MTFLGQCRADKELSARATTDPKGHEELAEAWAGHGVAKDWSQFPQKRESGSLMTLLPKME